MALPGVTTIIKDQFYTLSRTNAPSGPMVTLIGTRNTPSGTGGVIDLDPYALTNEQTVIAAYGYGSAIHRGYLELVAAGSLNISAVALPMGTTDTQLEYASNNPVSDPNDLTWQAFQAAEAANPDIIVPWGRGGHPLDWTSASSTPNAYLYDATPGNNSTVPTAPGFGYYADAICSNGQPMVARVAQLCSQITAASNPCFAVIGVKPYVGVGQYATQNIIAPQQATYLTFPNLTPASNQTQMSDYGPFVSVVAGELTPVTYPFDSTTNAFDWGYANAACFYAGTCSTLAEWIAPTGANLSNISQVRYNPTNTQAGNMIAANIVPLDLNFSNVPYWVDSPTYTLPGSDYARLTTIRIVFAAIQMVRQISQQYVGQAASLSVQNAFNTAISSGLRGMITLGALNGGTFNVTFYPNQNTAAVDLVLTPAFEIRNITLSVSVNF